MLQLANHDSLTGLFNRRRFLDQLRREINAILQSGHESALFFIDLDQFKYINDACGHPAGDRLICKVADELLRSIGHAGTVARSLRGTEYLLEFHEGALNHGGQTILPVARPCQISSFASAAMNLWCCCGKRTLPAPQPQLKTC